MIADPLEVVPGTRTEYSDPGMILLGRMVERVSDRPLDQDLAA